MLRRLMQAQRMARRFRRGRVPLLVVCVSLLILFALGYVGATGYPGYVPRPGTASGLYGCDSALFLGSCYRLQIALHNHLPPGDPAKVNLIAGGGSDCWDDLDLNRSLDQKPVDVGGTESFQTEVKRGAGCLGTAGISATRGLGLWVQERSGPWYVPVGVPAPGIYGVVFDEGPQTQTQGKFGFVGGLRTWAPRADGHGLICWDTKVSTKWLGNDRGILYQGNADIDVYGDQQCSRLVSDRIFGASPRQRVGAPKFAAQAAPRAASPPVAAARAAARAPGADNSVIVDLLSSVDIACRWYAHKDDSRTCTNLNPGDQTRWSIDNLSSDVREFKVTGNTTGTQEKKSVASAELTVPADVKKAGEVDVSKTQTTSYSTTMSSSHGAKVGGKIAFKTKGVFKFPLKFIEERTEVDVEINAEGNWSTTESKQTQNSNSVQVSMKAPADPGYTTRLDVFTTKRAANFTYTADLDFGKEGTVQNVTTPAEEALDQSPAPRQPCLAYIVGDKQVRNSLTFIGQQLINAGYKPDDSSLPRERQAFLQSMPFFFTSGPPCPGFPAGYAAAAGFKGDGVGTYDDLGVDQNGDPVQVMTGCISRTPYPPKTGRLSRAQLLSPRRWWIPGLRTGAGASPCQNVSINGGIVNSATPATLMDDRDTPGGAVGAPAPRLAGSRGSDVIMGSNAGGTIHTGGGVLDVVHAGRGPTRVVGEADENVLYGGPGRDVLVGQRGFNELHASGSGDTLRASNDYAVMYGGRGHTTFEGHNMRGTMFGGRGVDHMLATGDSSRLAMAGGAGNNVYELRGAGTPEIVQVPGGRGTVMTDHSFALPVNIDKAMATGHRRMTLRGNLGTRRLVANGAGDRLVAGPDAAAALVGGRGRDTIVFNALNNDRATGGRGGDRFVFTGNPQNVPRPPGFDYPARRSAPVITDFNPREGDRLVLRSSVFGSHVLNLRRSFHLVANRNPRPRCRCATLLLDTHTGLLSFDRDGTGPIADKVVVQLRHYRTIHRSWLKIQH